MAFTEASDGTKIFYRAVGTGPVLIISNASFSTHRHWDDAAARLSDSYRVVTWDYRGHGQSDAPDDDARFSLDRVVEDLAEIHRAVADDEPAFVAGLSVGGIVSMSYALKYPDRVRALLLCNTGPGFKKTEALEQWQTMLGKAAAKLEEVGIDRYLSGRRASAELLGLNPDSELAREAREGMLTSDVAGLARFARCVAGPVPNLVDRLAEIQHPSLVLVGEHDQAFLRASEVMAAKLPHAHRVVLKGAGHQVNMDQPGPFADEIRRFISRLQET